MTAAATDDGAAPFLDAIALIEANRRHDGAAVARILASADLGQVAVVLAQMVQTAIQTQRFTLDDFLAMQVDKTLERHGPWRD